MLEFIEENPDAQDASITALRTAQSFLTEQSMLKWNKKIGVMINLILNGEDATNKLSGIEQSALRKTSHLSVYQMFLLQKH